ncbi:MBL fold metallo-hydrolase [Salinisphaera hydrothermalis]|uniref:NUDIX hydrolase:Beta-lactamase-like protein n=1 Tax=Salinisphaera hydrothermalis (strain C41B8) TaxID=1304275 RepID=A0A084IKF2_SALHC|nr:MBL fold metallo-hydrolase [Salinisphaera hydrothermalis]KEZ77186.1 NUDIX hydrolase:Beta-lactamase-like protein [Salinisphaera hydrothermalis C41B8]
MIELEDRIAEPEMIGAGLRRLTAPNPSPMTGPGTNTFIVGHGPYLIVDPGVDDESHLQALIDACGGDIAAICLTHRHPDHVGGAAWLAERTGAPVCAWPKAELAHYDRPVHVDRPLIDNEILTVGEMPVIVRHTPGHAADHVAFELPAAGILLAGDALMSDATVVILPPDGHMGAYFDTLARLEQLPIERIAPAHGHILEQPQQTIADVLAHRRRREAQVVAALMPDELRSAEAIADRLYPQLHDRLRTMAALQVQAHLLHLAERGRAIDEGRGWRRTE